MSLEKYSGGLPPHRDLLLLDQSMLNVLHIRGDFDTIIATYKDQINLVEHLSKDFTFGAAAVPAQHWRQQEGRESSDDRGRNEIARVCERCSSSGGG